jgi:hypothetical protein
VDQVINEENNENDVDIVQKPVLIPKILEESLDKVEIFEEIAFYKRHSSLAEPINEEILEEEEVKSQTNKSHNRFLIPFSDEFELTTELIKFEHWKVRDLLSKDDEIEEEDLSSEQSF